MRSMLESHAARLAISVVLSASVSTMASAQDAPADEDSSVETGDIVVTATKNANGLTVQKAPLAVSAFGASNLEALHVERLSDLTNNVPNVNLNSTTSFPGFSNFTIRGMSVYSTIPSSTPTVGIFTDGIYQGTPAGAGFSTFDLEGVEVLRGPQGLFFGRNVTGGAILARTSTPSDQLTIKAQAAVETGLNKIGSVVVSGPLTENISGKIAGYYADDDGYFHNRFSNGSIGKSETWILRGALKFEHGGAASTVARAEYGERAGDGAAIQGHGRLPRANHFFGINQDEPGFIDAKWGQGTVETNIDVSFGDGTITNILGFRAVSQQALVDIDGTEVQGYNLYNSVKHEQFSDELRYAGSFGPVDVTGGIFYFTDKLNYVEDRTLFNRTVLLAGGADLRTWTFAQFANFDFHVLPTLTVSLGQRWSVEKKNVDIQPIIAQASSPCTRETRDCTAYARSGNKGTWYAFTPRVGVQWQPDTTTSVYGFWTKGFRSGGFNVRVTNAAQPITPYDQEVVDSYEVGVKRQWFDRMLTTNLAAFWNSYKDLQRDIQIFGTAAGTQQFTTNVADVDIRGIEFEAVLEPVRGVRINFNAGYLDHKWTDIRFDLSSNGSGAIGPEDYALKLPFLSPWSVGAGVEVNHDFGSFEVASRVAYNWQDAAASNDQNTRFLPAVKNLDADITFNFADGRYAVSFYGKNLLNRVTFGYDNPLTLTNAALGADSPLVTTFSPLGKGRILGVQLKFDY